MPDVSGKPGQSVAKEDLECTAGTTVEGYINADSPKTFVPVKLGRLFKRRG